MTNKPRQGPNNSNDLALIDGIPIPVNVVTQKLSFIGRTGGGKTYAAQKLAEQLLDKQIQMVALDPVGNWHGLRTSADGKGMGFPITIFGGEFADVPITEHSGAMVATIIVEYDISAIIDVSSMRKNQRKQFATDFAEELYELKKKKRSPMLLLLEEAQVFAPQRPFGGEERMLGAFEDIVKLGRNFGIGVAFITQRPQAVNKECLNQTEALFVFQLNGPQERKAIEDWIVDKGLDKKTVAEDLSGLNVGECFLWSPQWLRILKRVKILKKITYDASNTPVVGKQQKKVTRMLAPVDLEKIKSAIQTVVDEKKKNDPKELRRRITDLERQLAQNNAPAAAAPIPAHVLKELNESKDRCRNWETWFDNYVKLFRNGLNVIREFNNKSHDDIEAKLLSGERLKKYPETLATSIKREPVLVITEGHSGYEKTIEHKTEKRSGLNYGKDGVVRMHTPLHEADSEIKLGACERAILTVLAQRKYSGKKNTTRSQAGLLAGYAPKGGSFGNALSRLRTNGLLQGKKDDLEITDTGLNELGDFEKIPSSGSDLHQYWISKVGKCEGAILKVLFEKYPEAIPRSDFFEYTGYEPTGGSFGNALSRLRTLGLVEGFKEISAAAELFE